VRESKEFKEFKDSKKSEESKDFLDSFSSADFRRFLKDSEFVGFSQVSRHLAKYLPKVKKERNMRAILYS
jgi:hypothetical protein